MKMIDMFENYVKRFMIEHIHGLPRSFESVKEYRDNCMLLFNGWLILKKFPEYYTPRFKKLEALINKIDEFDTTLGRPIELHTVRSITNHPTWLEIHREAKTLPHP